MLMDVINVGVVTMALYVVRIIVLTLKHLFVLVVMMVIDYKMVNVFKVVRWLYVCHLQQDV